MEIKQNIPPEEYFRELENCEAHGGAVYYGETVLGIIQRFCEAQER